MGEICRFLDPKSYKPLHLPPYVNHTIFRFSLQLDYPRIQILKKAPQKKLYLTSPKLLEIAEPYTRTIPIRYACLDYKTFDECVCDY